MNNFRLGFVRVSILLLVALMVSGLLLPRTACAVGPDEFRKFWDAASTEIVEADNGFNQAFKAVLEAEQAGANVSSLLGKLDEAQKLVAEARTDYDAGNAGKAYGEAYISLSVANDVKSQALALKSLAVASATNVFQRDIVFSSVGAATFLVALDRKSVV